MKVYGNLEVEGNLKLRGTIKDRVVTEGGFYSGQFGEVAYKTDIAALPAEPGTNFYGMKVKYPDNSNVYRNLDTFTMHQECFYLSQNTPNTDEVSVSLRRAHFNKIVATDSVRRVLRTNVSTLFSSLSIPANRLQVGNLLKLRIFYRVINSSGASRTPTYTFIYNGSTIVNDTVPALSNNTQFTGVFESHIAIRSATSALWFMRDQREVDTDQPVGHGTIDGTIGTNNMAGDADLPIDLTVRSTFNLNITWSASSTQSFVHLYSYAELVP